MVSRGSSLAHELAMATAPGRRECAARSSLPPSVIVAAVVGAIVAAIIVVLVSKNRGK